MCGEEPPLEQDLTAQGSRSGHGDKPGSSCQGSPKNKNIGRPVSAEELIPGDPSCLGRTLRMYKGDGQNHRGR